MHSTLVDAIKLKLSLGFFEEEQIDAIKLKLSLGFFEEEQTFEAKWLRINGTVYGRGSVNVTDVVQESIPTFLRVENIVSVRSKWYMCGYETIPEKFVNQTWCYDCKVTDYVVAIDVSLLLPLSRSHALGYQNGEMLNVLMYTLPFIDNLR